MSDETFGIVVEIDPTKAKAGADTVDRALAGLETSGKEAGRSIGESLASGFSASSDAAAKARSEALASINAQKEAAHQYAREIAAASKLAAEEGRNAARAEAAAVKAAKAEQAAAARQYAQQMALEAKLAAEAGKVAAREEAAAVRAAKLEELEAARAVNRELAQRHAADMAGARSGSAGGSGLSGLLAGAGGQLAAAAGGIYAAKKVADEADAYVNLSNSLRVVTKDEADLSEVREKLFAVSERTRTSIQATTKLYTTFGKAILDTGRSSSQVLSIVESVNEAIKISGTGSEETSAAVEQLGKAMARGGAHGRELISIIEQAPVVADVIAKSLGVTRERLSQLGQEGKITSEVIIKAFEGAREELQDRFGKTAPTIKEEFIGLEDQFIKMVGAIADIGVISAVTGAIKLLADTIGAVATAIRAVKEADEFVAKKAGSDPSKGGLLTGFLHKENYDNSFWQAPAIAYDAYDKSLQAGLQRLFPSDNTIAKSAMDAYWKSFSEAFKTDTEKVAGNIGDAMGSLRKFVAEQVGDLASALSGPGPGVLNFGENLRNQVLARGITAELDPQSEKDRAAYSDLYDQSNKALEAKRKLADAERLVGLAVERNLPGADRANAILAQQRQLLREEIDPLAEVERHLQQETTLLGANAFARDRASKFLQIENSLRAKGIELTDEQQTQLYKLITAQQRAQQAAAIGDAKVSARKEEFKQLRDEADGVGKAQRELLEAEKAVAQAVASHQKGYQEANEILARKRDLLRDQLDPFGAILRNIERETGLLQANADQHKLITEIDKIRLKLRKQGVTLGIVEIAQLVDALAVQERAVKAHEDEARVLQQKTKILQELHGPEQESEDRFKAYDELLAEGKITVEEHAKAYEQLNKDVLDFANSLKGALLQGLDLAQGGLDTMADTTSKAMADIDKASDDLGKNLNKTLAHSFDSGLKSLIDFANTGKNSFRAFATSLLQDIELIVAKMLILQGVEAALGAGAIGSDTASLLSTVIGGTFGGHKAAGGSFMVGGSGGTDSQPVYFRATPGERVTVTPPGGSSAHGAPTVHVTPKVVVFTDMESAIREYHASAEGERVTLVHIAKNPAKTRAALAR